MRMNQDSDGRCILLILPYGGVGGMERLALNMYRHYRGLGDRVLVMKIVGTPEDIVTFGADEIVLSHRDLIHMSPLTRLAFYMSIPYSIAKTIREHDVTHSIAFGDMSNLFSSLSPSREFKVASIHSLRSVDTSDGVLNHLFRIAYRSTYSRFSRVVSISRAIRRDLLEECGYRFPENLEVIYNPHDLDAIAEAATEELTLHEAALFSGPTVLFLGRLSREKALWHLIRAFSVLLDRDVSARLIIVGDGDPDLTVELQRLIEGCGAAEQITLLGRKPNPYMYLSQADVLVLSSHVEGTPNVIVEAIALGVPVVSSFSTTGVAEMMSTRDVGDSELHDAPLHLEAGIMTPPLSGRFGAVTQEAPLMPAEMALADAIQAVLEDPVYRESVRRHRAELLAKFEIGRAARSYLREK